MTIICRTKTKESGLTVRAKLLPRRKGHPNRVRNVSRAVQVPVPVWRAFAHLITRKSKQRKKANGGTFWSAQMRRETRQKRFSNTTTRNWNLYYRSICQAALSLSMNICAGFWTYQTQKFQDESPFIAIQGIQEITNLPLADHSWLHPSVRLKWAR